VNDLSRAGLALCEGNHYDSACNFVFRLEIFECWIAQSFPKSGQGAMIDTEAYDMVFRRAACPFRDPLSTCDLDLFVGYNDWFGRPVTPPFEQFGYPLLREAEHCRRVHAGSVSRQADYPLLALGWFIFHPSALPSKRQASRFCSRSDGSLGQSMRARDFGGLEPPANILG
jgi:hypothetical protein